MHDATASYERTEFFLLKSWPMGVGGVGEKRGA